MYCLECGNEIPNNSKFCSFCGAKQIVAESPVVESAAITPEPIKTPPTTKKELKENVNR